MYLDFTVKIPQISGKITLKPKGKTTYVDYEYDRVYNPVKHYNVPKRATIGKMVEGSSDTMYPNSNFLKYFPDTQFPDDKSVAARSSCLRIGTYAVIKKIIENYKLDSILAKHMEPKDVKLFLDLAAYSIIAENNAAQYYPSYAYNHPLFTENMHVYSDSKISDFLKSITDDQSIGFLNEWNAKRNHRERIYISYDSTNKNCQAGDLRFVEYGHAKDDKSLPVFNYAMAYDCLNKEPLYYEDYPGSIVDVSQLQITLEKAKGYGYKNVGFILDRGYFSKANITFMDECKYDFVIMVKGKADLVHKLVLENKGSFEKKRECSIRQYKAYGTTVKAKLFATDTKERYFHIYHSGLKEAAECEALEERIERLSKALTKMYGKRFEAGEAFTEYFDLIYDDKGNLLLATEKTDVIENAMALCGYYVIATSSKMTAEEALVLYKSRDASEKLFRGDKSYLGNKSLRICSDEAASAKIFIEFVALIIRSKIYTCLKEAMESSDSKQNYMTVPAAIRELEKIEMIKQLDSIYRMDHAVTATQKTILKAFFVDSDYIKQTVAEISQVLTAN